MPLIYKKMSLFDAPVGSTLVHASNANGVWGSGIAKDMKDRFPGAFHSYKECCEQERMLSKFDMVTEGGYNIASIVTSDSYGTKVDSPEEILVSTTIALNDLCDYLSDTDRNVVYSNKFNSGLFKVPWERTESILKVLVDRYNINWIVCEL